MQNEDTHRPPAEEEDALCRSACGRSMSELIANAIHNGDAPTYNEAHLLTASDRIVFSIWMRSLAIARRGQIVHLVGRAGPLKVHIKHIAPTLFARLTQRDLPGEAKRRPYRHISELELLHQAARHSRNTEGEPDGIWPPPARYM
ncbi:hypothetical protein CNMCM5623_002514 [Aspergillus felis]|uniref:Uncharacterized protein n=1 Tax=Aspergillus felis TaxID=1287682 RepID=A0A8H6QC98_9EURO|nr:hypothetical protein CNMCM5623_002514 [Aspergillus felis]